MLLSPFDVRQGNFGGLLINAVTKSGTNELHGSVSRLHAQPDLTRTQPYLNDFTQQQYGGSLGGPIIKDKAFFFVERRACSSQKQPTTGPYIGSPDATSLRRSIEQL